MTEKSKCILEFPQIEYTIIRNFKLLKKYELCSGLGLRVLCESLFLELVFLVGSSISVHKCSSFSFLRVYFSSSNITQISHVRNKGVRPHYEIFTKGQRETLWVLLGSLPFVTENISLQIEVTPDIFFNGG
jgi:hypothetical protein